MGEYKKSPAFVGYYICEHVNVIERCLKTQCLDLSRLRKMIHHDRHKFVWKRYQYKSIWGCNQKDLSPNLGYCFNADEVQSLSSAFNLFIAVVEEIASDQQRCLKEKPQCSAPWLKPLICQWDQFKQNRKILHK